jgi:hypothetical protein
MTAPLTHHIPWDRPGQPRDRLNAICGVMILRQDSAPRPTCPACQAILREWELADQEIEAALAAERLL